MKAGKERKLKITKGGTCFTFDKFAEKGG